MSHHFRDKRGFTLIEFLVSIGIVFVILAIIVSGQSTYTDTAALSNLADEMGLTISQAQAYGIGVRELSPGSSDFTGSFGISLNLLESGSKTDYLSFADRNGNDFYDGDWACAVGGASECLEKIGITRGNYIDSLCLVRTAGADLCNIDRTDITFARPSTEAELLFFSNGGQPFNPANISGARIVLKSPGGATRSVIVYKTGQVSIESSYAYPDIPPPTVTLSANPNPISYNSYSNIYWSSTDATSCNASGGTGWVLGDKALSGAESTSNLTSNQTYTLTCTGPEGYDAENVTVTVGASPPTVATGGTITYAGGYTIHTFTSNGTFNVTSIKPGATVEVLIVGGGGGSHVGGGGGGGAIINNSVPITIQSYPVVVGAGGLICYSGQNSSALSLTASGGGGDCGAAGFAGGSGGGGYPGYNGGSGTSGQGKDGGNGGSAGGGGGGGASSKGSNGSPSRGGDGGNAVASSISGSSLYYSGGGGGGSSGTGGSGGGGGGGAGNTQAGSPGTPNTGGGAGGGWYVNGNVGGSGIVIIRYIP